VKVQEYIREGGKNPYNEWFNSLKQEAAAKVAMAKYRLETGNTSSIKWIGAIGEYRIDWGPDYRIYLAQDGKNLIVLFGGGTKKTQNKDINIANQLHKEYKQRKRIAAKKAAEEPAKRARNRSNSKSSSRRKRK
tara:strand:- start:52 stop:453 length:402 start_codon:yes stop_codon:yes gene_type:complete